jgi:hypothetical protein
MKKIIWTFFVLFSWLGFSSCKPMQTDGQGITGKVTWIEGNQMPMISDSGEKRKEPEGIKRTVLIYPLTKFSDLKLENSLFIPPTTQALKEVETDSKGKFTIQLSPGRYSVFTVEEGGLFANIFDGEGNVMPVTVKEGQWTLLDILVNYKANY